MPVTRRSNLNKHLVAREDKQVPVVDNMDHGSVACSGSRIGGKSRSSNSSKKAKAALQLAELKQKQIELDNSLRLAAVKNEVDMAKLQVTLAEESESEEENHPPTEPDRSNVMNRYLDDCRVQRPSVDTSDECLVVPQEYNLRLDLPKVEINHFDGNPTQYWLFIRQFEFCIDKRVRDPGQRLLYLMYYCRDRAKEAIKGCAMLEPLQGYARARQILKDRFGQPHKIARALIEGIFDGVKSHLNEVEFLDALATNMQNCEIALSQMNYIADLNSITTLEGVVRKLPLAIQDHWIMRADVIAQTGREPTFADLRVFVMERNRIASSRYAQIARETEQKQLKPVRQSYGPKFYDKARASTSNSYLAYQEDEKNAKACFACDGHHPLEKCEEFIKLDVPSRWNLVKEKSLCFMCIDGEHNASGCRKHTPCGTAGCRGRHHKLLHVVKRAGPKGSEHETGLCASTNVRTSSVQLGTVPIRVKGPLGEIQTYALLDNGSDTTLVKGDLLKRLGIKSQPSELTISTVTSTTKMQTNKCSLEIAGIGANVDITVDVAYAVECLPIHTARWRREEIELRWPHLSDIPFCNIGDGEVTVLIGCDVPEAHWVIEQRVGGRSHPYATKTRLGWMLHGPTNVYNSKGVNYATNRNDQLCLDLKKMYDYEFMDTSDDRKCLSVDESRALKIVTEGTKLVEGRYEVPLPWRSSNPSLPDNLASATKRLLQLRKRFFRDRDLFVQYTKVINQHIERGYAVRAARSIKGHCWYLPHHPVINPKKPGKVRVVFDCAAKWNQTSLNDQLYSGPDTTSDLCQILMRFRMERVAVAADIEEMFLRVKVPVKDQDALRFLWWAEDDMSTDPIPFRLTVHPFGATSSPFCANYALRRALDGVKFSRWDVPSECFYVDDLLTSFEDAQTAIDFSQDVSSLLSKAGFQLRKWLSNKREVLESLNPGNNADSLLCLSESKLPCERALGIEWDAETDKLRFSFKFQERSLTRRGILSCVSSMFDPLGLIAPLLLPVKCLLQDLCKRGLDWDAHISAEEELVWTTWKKSMEQVGSITLDRCVKNELQDGATDIQLHIFCDASERGYGTAVYMRYSKSDGFSSKLIFGKARVAPIKTVTIPRLELSAAVLGIRAYQLVMRNLRNGLCTAYFWTDSTIVLYYINNVTQRFSTFVANRLTTIHDCSEPGQWGHVSSNLNPADIASRGCYVNDKTLELWFNGPEFLRSPMELWPMQPESFEVPSLIEYKTNKVCAVTATKMEGCKQLFAYYSKWFKLLKAVAWLMRYKTYLLLMSGVKPDISLPTGSLRAEEMREAANSIIRVMQQDNMSRELSWLQRTEAGDADAYKQMMRRSSLRRLCPTLRNGIISVGGRLGYSSFPEDFKHPAILPREHPVTEMVVRHHHEVEGHCGPTQLLAVLRQRYWILNGKTMVKKVVNKCTYCRRRNVSIGQQLMAPLPTVRIEPGWRAFSYVGVDYFGPLLVKKNRSMEKRYGCLFTCLQIRAVHIEIAHDLSTDSYLMAMMRFMGRRGTPEEIYSDNGTAFVGAENELRTHLSELSQERINDHMLKLGIQWHFIPPAASHRGGVWERMIRSVRKLLSVLPGEQTLTDEMLATLIVEAERIINGRPIVPLNDDPTEPNALTPNTLMLLHDNQSNLATDDLKTRYIKCWKRVNHLTQTFWTRWVNEYLPTLQTRQKWLNRNRNFVVGDVVLVVSEPRKWGKWPLGRIMKIEMDDDGLVRTGLVRTGGRDLRRDIRKLVLLEGVE